MVKVDGHANDLDVHLLNIATQQDNHTDHMSAEIQSNVGDAIQERLVWDKISREWSIGELRGAGRSRAARHHRAMNETSRAAIVAAEVGVAMDSVDDQATDVLQKCREEKHVVADQWSRELEADDRRPVTIRVPQYTYLAQVTEGSGADPTTGIVPPLDVMGEYDLTAELRAGAIILPDTPAFQARSQINAEREKWRKHIRDKVSYLLKSNPPQKIENITDPALREETIVKLADGIALYYIRSVKEFLVERPGAKPKRWFRWPWEDEFNAPYCEDWQEGMYKRLMNLENQGKPAYHVVKFLMARNGKGGTHNYVIMVPQGVKIQTDTDGRILNYNEIKDKMLVFDPWWDLMPRVYHPDKEPFPPTHTGGLTR
jgi:hypothetical protein